MKERNGWLQEQLRSIFITLDGESLVRDLYRSILGREADPGGLASYTALLRRTGGVTPVVEDLLLSSEFQTKEFANTAADLVQGVYQGILGRAASPEELETGTALANRTNSIAPLAANLLLSSEFRRKAFLDASASLVRAAYQGILGREASPEELESGAVLTKRSDSIGPLVESLLLSGEFSKRSIAVTAPALVHAIYEGILGRVPDSEGLKAHTERLVKEQNLATLLRQITECDEFTLKSRAAIAELGGGLTQLYLDGPRIVETEVTSEQFSLLFNRLRGQWTKLGETEPHWSVLTDHKFKADTFAAHEDEFYGSGRNTFSIIENFFRRSGREINRAGTVLELGCGTGRVTHALADVYAHVIAVDVSPGNLRLCEEKLRKRGKSNVECILLKSPDDIEKIPPVDFFFSTIVLQHNPPPVIQYFLTQILGKIRPSGSVLFQVPTNTPGYSFKVREYLESEVPVMDMHCLPMQKVFSLLAKNQLIPIEVLMDTWTGSLGSHTFFAARE